MLSHPSLAALCEAPLPASGQSIDSIAALALDLETTGLDPDTDMILSFGWIGIDAGAIVATTAGHRLCAVTTDDADQSRVGASATIHGITDDHLMAGEPVQAVLLDFAAAAAGRLFIAHGASIEQGFLNSACKRLYGSPLPLAFIDTLEVEKQLLSRRSGPYSMAGDDLRLNACRKRYGLPRYREHHALTDALACAELFLAQAERLSPARVRDFL